MTSRRKRKTRESSF